MRSQVFFVVLATCCFALLPSSAQATELAELSTSLYHAEQSFQRGRTGEAQAAAAAVAARLDALLSEGSDDRMRRKRESLHWLAQTLARGGDLAKLAASATTAIDGAAQPMLLVRNKDDAGAACQQALALPAAEAVAIYLGSKGETHDTAWLHWRAPAPGPYLLRSRGAGTDTVLSHFEDCGDARPALRDDDTHGLDAELLLQARYAGQVFLLELRNEGMSGRVSLKALSIKGISGRVVEDATGAPVTGLLVRAFSPDGFHAGSTEYTDENGDYTVLIAGYDHITEFFVRTAEYQTPPRLLHEAWDNAPCASAHATITITGCEGAATIALADGEIRTGIDFALGTGARLAGRVVDSRTGDAVPNALVSIVDSGNVVRGVRTDAAGRYEANALRPGSVRAYVMATEFEPQIFSGQPCASLHSCDATNGTPISLSESSPASADFSLTPLAHIDLDLTLASARDYWQSMAQFQLHNAAGVILPVQQTALGNGRFRLGPLTPGTYRLNARILDQSLGQWYDGLDCVSDCFAERDSATPIVIVQGEGGVQLSMDLRLRPVLTGRLTVADTGAPIAGAQVKVYRAPSGIFAGIKQTDANGQYRFSDLNFDSYYVMTSVPQFIDQIFYAKECEHFTHMTDCLPATALAVTMTGASPVADFQLRRSPRVTGRFFNSERPVSTTTFRFDSVLLSRVEGGLGSGIVQIDAARGRYTLTDYEPGNYHVAAKAAGYYMQVSDNVNCSRVGSEFSWVIICPWERGRVYTLANEDQEVNFNLRPYGRVVRVSNTMGQPIGQVAVDMWNLEGDRLGTLLTRADGTLDLHLDYFGTTQVLISTDNYQGYIDQVYDGIACPAGSSVYRGGCSLAGGVPVAVPVTDPDVPELIITMTSGMLVFTSGFEN